MSDYIDRIGGARSALAFKAPCRVATTGPITLSGFQTIDGELLAASDANLRVVVKDQADPREHGVWIADAGPWRRAKDFDGNNDFVKGTRIYVTSGTTQEKSEFVVVSDDPQVIGVTEIEFEVSVSAIEAADLAEQWATKIDGIVNSEDYSSKSWAIGGTGVTNTASRGAAKEWAISPEDDPVDGTEFSAKHYAAKAAASAQSAAATSGELPRVSEALLKDLDTGIHAFAYLTDVGREGIFAWKTGDYADEITADPLEGIYIKADAVASSSGSWVRVVKTPAIVTWWGAVGDGVTDDLASINAALATGLPIMVPDGNYLISDAITGLVSNQMLYGESIDGTRITHGSSMLVATSIDNVVLRDLTFYGPHSSTAYQTSISTCHNWRIENCRFQNTNSIWYLADCDGWYWDVEFLEVRGTCVNLIPGRRHFVKRCKARNNGSFTWWLQDGATQNVITGLHRYLDLSTITSYLLNLESGGVPTSTSNRVGFEAVGIRFGASNNQVIAPIIESCAENGVSFSGDRNKLIGGHIINPEILGVGLYGTHNKVIGVSVFGGGSGTSAAAFQAAANAGGIGRHNQFIGCEAFGGQTGFVFKNDAYQEWVSGGGTAPSYTKSISGANTRVYRRIGASAGVYGTVRPVHESGTVSDGLNDWEYLSKVGSSQTLSARNNQCIGCYADGMSVADFTDSTDNTTNDFEACNASQSFFSTRGTFTRGGHSERHDVTISGATIDVTGYGFVRCTNSGTITDIDSSDPNYSEVDITAQTGTVNITHNSSKIRCRGGTNQSIVVNEGSLRFRKVSTGVFEQVG